MTSNKNIGNNSDISIVRKSLPQNNKEIKEEIKVEKISNPNSIPEIKPSKITMEVFKKIYRILI